jgi:cytochrome c-type biogenesis protein CcmH/NrfG
VVVTAIAADPRQASLHALLGDLYARTGLPHEAEEAYGRARALASPDRSD